MALAQRKGRKAEDEAEAKLEQEEAEGWVLVSYVAPWDPCTSSGAEQVLPIDAVRESKSMCRDLSLVRAATRAQGDGRYRSLLELRAAASPGAAPASPMGVARNGPGRDGDASGGEGESMAALNARQAALNRCNLADRYARGPCQS